MTGIIDIGSNSTRLFFCGRKETVTTRLGEGLGKSGLLSKSAIDRTLQAVCGFVDTVRASGGTVRVFGTEALRAAKNSDVFTNKLDLLRGINVHIISGGEEAELALLGACGGSGGSVIDIGGASIEIVCGDGAAIIAQKSLPMGAVRLTEAGEGKPDLMAEIIHEKISGCGGMNISGDVYGVAGTFTSLASMKLGMNEYDPGLVHGSILTRTDIDKLLASLVLFNGDSDAIFAAYPVIGYPRAGIITAGALIAREIMDGLRLKQLTVSENDNLEGYYKKYVN